MDRSWVTDVKEGTVCMKNYQTVMSLQTIFVPSLYNVV